MLRTRSMRTALVAGASAVAALSAGAALAEDGAAAGPTYAVVLKLDELVVVIDEPTTPAVPVSSAPFLNTPAFELGLPSLERTDLLVAEDYRLQPERCAARCSDLAARMAFQLNEQDVSVSVGATANIADRLDSFGSPGDRPRWYLFVAADAQAMSWGFNKDEHSSSVRLDDMRMLGDAQAGLGGRVGGGDLAIGYVTREISHMGAERRESFVGLTFGWEG